MFPLNANQEPMLRAVSSDHVSCVGAGGDIPQFVVRKTPQLSAGFFEHLCAQPNISSDSHMVRH